MQVSTKWLKVYRFFVCGVITFIFILHVADWVTIPTLQRMENILYDLRLRATANQGIDDRIVIVDIDENSLANEGRWPWRRDKMAYLMDMLFDYYAIRMVGFDIVFSEPDTSAGIELLEKLATGPLQKDPAFLETFETMRPQLSYDKLFANSLKNRPVVLGYLFSHLLEKTPEIGALPNSINSQDESLSSGLFEQQSYVANLPVLQKSAMSAGFFSNPSVDEDGIYRRLPLLVSYQQKTYEALSLAMFRALLDLPAVKYSMGYQYGKTDIDKRLEVIDIDGFHIPVNQKSILLVPFRGKQGSFKYISATDVLNGVLDQAELKDKIVLVGTTAAGLFDSRATPVQSVYPGVEVHANILSGLLDQTIKSRPSYILGIEVIELLLVFGLAVLVFPYLSVLSAASLFAGLLISGTAFNYYSWVSLKVDTLLATPLTLLVILFGVQILFSYFFESRKKKQLGSMFGQYIPPELVAEMTQSDEEYSLKGESREMTVLFSDVRGFTSISENLDPQALCELINAILTPVTQVIHESKGTIDKYIGDAIMAFWGAPVHNAQHAFYAVKAGLTILKTLDAIQDEFSQKGWPKIEIGIGLNTGKMSVGNMGSQFRVAYTVMGDAVNLGSRLEGLTKQYGVRMLVSESTALVTPEFAYREVDKVKVKGKQLAISIYEPLGFKGDLSDEILAELALLNLAFEQYRDQHWHDAKVSFKHLSEMYADNKLYAIYLERIAYFEKSPPPIDWDGSFVHTSK